MMMMRTMHNARLGQNGFTLLELLIVLVIAAVLMGIAMLSYDFVLREQVKSASKELFADLQAARTNAATKGPTNATSFGGNISPNRRGFGIRFASQTSYVSFDFNDANENFQYDGVAEEVATDTKKLLPRRLWIQAGGALVAPANTVVIFDRFGSPRQLDWSMLPTPFTIAIDNSSLPTYKKCIRIWPNSIREGNWNAATGTCVEQ